LDVVAEVTKLFEDLNMYGFDSSRNQDIPVTVSPPPPLNTSFVPTPPRPPLPHEVRTPGRPPMPADTDDEEGLFTSTPGNNRPIHAAAHGLYQEVRQWDHTDNEIIAAAKKIAYLMAHLSELVRPSRGTKRELIACAKGLAEVSERITELSKELARHCTDKKIRTNLLQVCEKIPTLGTQLRVLSTVKATMMCNNMDTEEDQEAMNMLVFNAQKLNEAVKVKIF
jgi:vinculin